MANEGIKCIVLYQDSQRTFRMDKWALIVAVCITLLLFTQVNHIHCGATVEQMQKSMTMVRSVCLPKNKITEDMADGLRNGLLPDEKPLKCYVHCCLEMTGMMKKSKINYEASLKQIDMLMPDDIKDPYRSALSACKDSAVGVKDPCDAAYTLLKCMFKQYPEMLFP